MQKEETDNTKVSIQIIKNGEETGTRTFTF